MLLLNVSCPYRFWHHLEQIIKSTLSILEYFILYSVDFSEKFFFNVTKIGVKTFAGMNFELACHKWWYDHAE